jgi:drug/metabolite transporter (DMT)-like permease
MAKSKTILADLGLFYAAAIWGSTFFIVKDALAGVDPVVMVAYRFILAGLILLGYLLIKKKPLFKDFGKGLLLAVILWFLYVPQTIGLKYTTASNSGFITGLFVAFVPLFLRTIFKRKPTLMELLASIISLLGLWILTGGLKDINIGDILTLLAAMTYALHLLYSDKFIKSGIDPVIISCQQFLIIGLLSFLVAAVMGLPFEIKTTGTLWRILFLTFFPTFTAFVIQMFAQKITSPLRVSLIFALEPVFAGIFAWTLGGETFVWRSAVGGLLIFTALVISGLPIRSADK